MKKQQKGCGNRTFDMAATANDVQAVCEYIQRTIRTSDVGDGSALVLSAIGADDVHAALDHYGEPHDCTSLELRVRFHRLDGPPHVEWIATAEGVDDTGRHFQGRGHRAVEAQAAMRKAAKRAAA